MTENVAERSVRPTPQRYAGNVESKKAKRGGLHHARERYRSRVESRNELRRQQRPHAESLERVFSAAHTIIGLQRYAANEPQHRTAVDAAELIPDEVRCQ